MANSLLWITITVCILTIHAQTNTRAPSTAPTRCSSNGYNAGDCDDERTPYPTKEEYTAAPITHKERATLLPTSTSAPTMDGYTSAPTPPTLSPTTDPLHHGRNPAITKTSVPTSAEPTRNPIFHDLDTYYPSHSPSWSPTKFGETRAPTPPSPSPTLTPSRNPTMSPSKNPTVTPTLSPSTQPTTAAVEVKESTHSGGSPGNINAEASPTDDVLLDLTSILLIVFGILICGILCGILYYWYGRKRAVKRAQALQFRFNANRAMELDRVKSNTYSDKRTNLLMNMGHDGPIRVPEDEPGGVIDTNDIIILSPQTNDPALDMITKGNGDGMNMNMNNNKYLNVGQDVDEFDDNVTDPIIDKITDNGMEINMNEDEDEVVDGIDNNDYVTAGGEDINMNETDEDSK